MIKNEDIYFKLSNKNISYYKNKVNYNIKVGDYININSNDISIGSSIKITGICDICGKERKISKKSYYQQIKSNNIFTCSKKCSVIKSKKTNIDKYGVDNPSKSNYIKCKIKNIILDKYGQENIMYLDRYKEKKYLTNVERWGVKHPSKLDVIKNKVKQKNIEKFGFEYPAKNKDILEKMKNTNMMKYGFYSFSKTDEFKEILSKHNFEKMKNKFEVNNLQLLDISQRGYNLLCNRCGKTFTILHTLMYTRRINDFEICTFCNPKKSKIKEEELYNYILGIYSGKVLRNFRKVITNELDIFIPEKNIAFEFNGLYWHSELYKDKLYHLNKTLECNQKGITLIHIWEDDWDNKKDIVKSIILNKLGLTPTKIFARKCQIKEITDNLIIREFLNKNHIQGFVGSKIKLGLFYNNELVSLMTFGNLRKSLGQKSSDGDYELLRFCNKLNTSVVGGASKLFNYFIKNYSPNSIISYSDLSRGNGNLYEKLGFNKQHQTNPNYYWIVNGIKENRFNYRKDVLVKMGEDPSKTEVEIMHSKGHYRLFDCGNKKFVFLNKN